MAVEVMVRTYSGRNQQEAAERYASDALQLADQGWAVASQAWVRGEWPWSAYLVAGVTVFVGVGILLLILFALVKPVRTLMVTYQRPATEAVAA